MSITSTPLLAPFDGPYRRVMSVRFERLTPAIGASVHEFDPRGVEDGSAVDKLYAGLIDHQVLFLERAALDVTSLARLGRALGPVANTHHQYDTHPEDRDVVVLAWDGENRPDAAEWHSDMTYRPGGVFASVLQAVELPPLGGDTLWASMYAVHDALPPGLRADLAGMEAVHDMGAFRTPAYRQGGADGIGEALVAAGSAVHPVIDHHPVTGRPFLNVSESFTRWIIGLSAPESARILTLLFDQINRPDYHVRLRWSPGTIAIWDNRGTQHYACADYLPHRRVMWRVAVTDDPRATA